jgi:hypothetical protein
MVLLKNVGDVEQLNYRVAKHSLTGIHRKLLKLNHFPSDFFNDSTPHCLQSQKLQGGKKVLGPAYLFQD